MSLTSKLLWAPQHHRSSNPNPADTRLPITLSKFKTLSEMLPSGYNNQAPQPPIKKQYSYNNPSSFNRNSQEVTLNLIREISSIKLVPISSKATVQTENIIVTKVRAIAQNHINRSEYNFQFSIKIT